MLLHNRLDILIFEKSKKLFFSIDLLVLAATKLATKNEKIETYGRLADDMDVKERKISVIVGTTGKIPLHCAKYYVFIVMDV